MKAKEIMSKTPTVVTPDTSVQEAARMMQSEDVGVLPVVDSQGSRRLVGLITDRDIAIRVVAEGRTGDEARVREIMSESPKTCRENDDVDSVMDLMGREQVRRVPVVDERGSLVGIIAQADIAREAKDEKKVERTVEKISEPGGKHSH